ncbi:type 1 glutamine amidotransferase [Acinetobacter qingfengensis]|uniref:GMP synthase n=1 Tax=Acinetobacter qingfengensis TaxID=1262585 RepID=A0A1E7R2Y1_9GAMM|nr:type 1 glutamine amidotransferase [Acinetobacter qingfengensis]KAA8733800.1 type 1 glutamine amidotransferase [Acinetobacter qingfengensis]OEY93688.1 GMP synthase [Acinetobacter qingfengensis]
MISSLKVHYFQHIAEEGLGSCESYLKQLGAHITTTEFFALPPEQKLEIEALPNVEDVDLLIIMGGRMSVNDEALYPWLITEKRWIRRFIALGKPVIGLCLGGQMIANALGASVTQNLNQEIGWTEIFAIPHYPEDCFIVPEKVEVMEWHRETFSLPRGAKLLASSHVCENQIFQIGDNILGFQFHPEITPAALRVFLENDEDLEKSIEHQHIKSQIQHTFHPTEYIKFRAGNELLNRAIDYVLQRTQILHYNIQSNYFRLANS